LRYVISPVAVACGYQEPVRADHLGAPGIITTQIIERIVEDELVIADLTDSNANVFYELAIRHLIKKPLVQLIEKGQRIPFDVAPTRIIELDHTDLDSVAAAKEELGRQIQASELEPDKVDNPISIAFDLRSLNRNDSSQGRSMEDLTSDMASISAALRGMSTKLFMLDKLQDFDSMVQKLEEFQNLLNRIESATEQGFGLNRYSMDDIGGALNELADDIENIKTKMESLDNKVGDFDNKLDQLNYDSNVQ
jgi:uncharacterized protein YukE